MKQSIPAGMLVILLLVACLQAAASETDLFDSLLPENISSLRVNLVPRGAQLGFETTVAGDDPRAGALATVLREAQLGGGHRCANQGAIRFRMKDGRVIGVGLLPSHTSGVYELRAYDGERFAAAYRVGRATLLAALEGLGVPLDDAAFGE